MKHLENISGEQIGENQAQLTEEVHGESCLISDRTECMEFMSNSYSSVSDKQLRTTLADETHRLRPEFIIIMNT